MGIECGLSDVHDIIEIAQGVSVRYGRCAS